MTFEVSKFPGYSIVDLLKLVTSNYFSPDELEVARNHLTLGMSYGKVISMPAEQAQSEMRKSTCGLTIPGAKVLVYPPDRVPGDLSYVSFQLMDVIRMAFPLPNDLSEEDTASWFGHDLWRGLLPIMRNSPVINLLLTSNRLEKYVLSDTCGEENSQTSRPF